MIAIRRRRQPSSLETKAALAAGRTTWSTQGLPEQDLDPIVLSDGPHGVRRTVTDAAIIAADPSTCFPTAAALASSWNVPLIRRVGEAIGVEARAQGVSVVLGPGMNIKRHPLGGRNFEYFSEDPRLSGFLAAAMVEGIQQAGVGACVKHFAVNNQETIRMTVDAIVDERALHEIYLAGFEHAIRTARPWTVMCSYNRINGTYASDDGWLLSDVLRDRWGFDGLVMSDWGATNDRVAGIDAGMDLEMPNSGGVNDEVIVEAVESGRLSMRRLDRVVERVSTLIERGNAAVVDALPGRLTDTAAGRAIADRHHELAQEAAAASTVLLTNDGVLPLAAEGRVAVLGAFATEPRFQGAGSSQVTPTQVDQLADAIGERIGDAGRVEVAAGYDPTSDEERIDLLDEARLIARAVDVAVVVVGLPAIYESEGFDRDHMRLPDSHNALVRAVADANPNTVVVLMHGAPVQLPWLDRVRAVITGHLSGQGGGVGLARVLFGDAEPAGRLAETSPIRTADHGADAWFPGVGRQVQYREGIFVGYRWFDTVDAPVLFPFGHGGSYTTFEYSNPSVLGVADGDRDLWPAVNVDIENTGDRAGVEVVQVYVRRADSDVMRPFQTLGGFARVEIEPGETKTVTVSLDRWSFAHHDIGTGDWAVEGGPVTLAVGSSSRDIRVTAPLDVASSWAPLAPAEAPPRSAADLDDDERFERLLGHAIPEPDAIEPFHRNSTLDEVTSTGLGRGLKAGAVSAAQRQLRVDGELDPVTGRLVDRMMSEAPLRAIALLGGGRLSWANLDRMIVGMNTARRLRRRRS